MHEASVSAAAKQGNGHAALSTTIATTATGTISTKKFMDVIQGLYSIIHQLDHNQKINNVALEKIIHCVNVLEGAAKDFG
jgi:hypothetical protein